MTLGVITPGEIVSQIGSKEGEKVEISVRPTATNIKRLFGREDVLGCRPTAKISSNIRSKNRGQKDI